MSSNPVHGEMSSTQHYVIKFVNDLRQVGGFFLVLRFPPPTNLKHDHDITEILQKVALNTITLTLNDDFIHHKIVDISMNIIF